MTTKHRNRGATHQQPSLYAERRMTFETGKRRRETGELERETRKPEPGRRGPHSMSRGCGCRPARPKSGFRSLVLDPFAGIPYRAIRGRLGNRVYKTYGDKVIVTRVPCFVGYVPTKAQRERREKLRAATAYAQAVYAAPAAKAVYVAAAKALGRQPFRLAVSDFLHGRPRVTLAPAGISRIDSVGCRGADSLRPRFANEAKGAASLRPDSHQLEHERHERQTCVVAVVWLRTSWKPHYGATRRPRMIRSRSTPSRTATRGRCAQRLKPCDSNKRRLGALWPKI
jgi:hypothetical protein